ncbi:MAG: hypothetical protein H2184_15590 [Candidatus Galacturonibacter soehngenii]|nr:hypothetical protein [Candidatus Galacturonibacter soehngenii]
MYKKLMMACICILVLTVAACKSKNTGDNATTSDIQKDTKSNETKDISAEDEKNTDDFENIEESDINSETDKSKGDSNKENTNEERKNTYQDVDIKVPSIHED